MMSADRDALLCDLAETYGIYDFRALPVTTLATLSAGLGEKSRIKTILYGSTPTRTEVMLAAAVDRLSMLQWFFSEDGQNSTNRPESILDVLLHGGTKPQGKEASFATAEDYETAWANITGVKHG